MSKSDGGAAFPTMEFERVGEYVHSDIVHPGMTLRDWFAGMCMQGMLASGPGSQMGLQVWSNNDKCATWAYEQADAMLKTREAK